MSLVIDERATTVKKVIGSYVYYAFQVDRMFYCQKFEVIGIAFELGRRPVLTIALCDSVDTIPPGYKLTVCSGTVSYDREQAINNAMDFHRYSVDRYGELLGDGGD